MTAEDISKKLDELEQELTKANARADKAEAELLIAKLDDEDREAFDTLPQEDQTAFVAADETKRSEMLEKARNTIAKRNELPTEIQKRLDDITKRMNDAEARATAAETIAKRANDERRMTELTKRAEDEFAGLPGTAVEKAHVLKSLEKLSEEERSEVEKMLKAGNECLSGQMKPVGKSGSSDMAGDAWAKIEKRSEVLAGEKKISKAKAMQEFLETPEGQQLYDQHLEEKEQ